MLKYNIWKNAQNWITIVNHSRSWKETRLFAQNLYFLSVKMVKNKYMCFLHFLMSVNGSQSRFHFREFKRVFLNFCLTLICFFFFLLHILTFILLTEFIFFRVTYSIQRINLYKVFRCLYIWKKRRICQYYRI